MLKLDTEKLLYFTYCPGCSRRPPFYGVVPEHGNEPGTNRFTGSILSGIEHDRFVVVIKRMNCHNTPGIQGLGKRLLFLPCPNLTPEKAISIARKFKAQKKIDMMIVDYIGRMDK